MPNDTADELRNKLTRYRRTRSMTAPSMHRWLDGMIADTEEQLRQLTGDPAELDGNARPTPPVAVWVAPQSPPHLPS